MITRSLRPLLLLLLMLPVCANAQFARALSADDFAKVVAGKNDRERSARTVGRTGACATGAGRGRELDVSLSRTFDRRMFWVEVSPEGTVRGTSDTADYNAGPYRGRNRRYAVSIPCPAATQASMPPASGRTRANPRSRSSIATLTAVHLVGHAQ
jgi:hypothetical protein